MPKLPVKRPSATPLSARAAAAPPDPEAALIGQEEQEKNDALDVIVADAFKKAQLFAKVRELEGDPNWRGYGKIFDADAETITNGAAAHIRNTDLRERWLGQARDHNASLKRSLLTGGTKRTRRHRMDELRAALTLLGSIYSHPDTGDDAREHILNDMTATATLAQRVVGPSAAETLCADFIEDTVSRHAEERIWSDPAGLLDDLADAAESGSPSVAHAHYEQWLPPERRKDLSRLAHRAQTLLGRQELQAAREGAFRGAAPDGVRLERAGRSLPATDVEETRRMTDAALDVHRAVADLSDMDPLEAASLLESRPELQPAWIALEEERRRDPVRALSGGPVHVRAGSGLQTGALAQSSAYREPDWTFRTRPAREIEETEAMLAARGRRHARGRRGGDASTSSPSASTVAEQEQRIEARLAAQQRLMPERETEWRTISQKEADDLLSLSDEGRRSGPGYAKALRAAYARAHELYGPKYAGRAVSEAAGFQLAKEKAASAEETGLARAIDDLVLVRFEAHGFESQPTKEPDHSDAESKIRLASDGTPESVVGAPVAKRAPEEETPQAPAAKATAAADDGARLWPESLTDAVGGFPPETVDTSHVLALIPDTPKADAVQDPPPAVEPPKTIAEKPSPAGKDETAGGPSVAAASILPAGVVLAPTIADMLVKGGSHALRAAAAAAGIPVAAFVAALTAFSSSTNDEKFTPLSPRLRIRTGEHAPIVEQQMPDGKWRALQDVIVGKHPDGKLWIDEPQLRVALGDEEVDAIKRNPGYAEGPAIQPPPPLINVIAPRPIPPIEVFPITEFKLPPADMPVVFDIGPFITPIHEAKPEDYVFYAIKAEEFKQGGNWQGAAIPEKTLKKQNPSVQVIEDAWKQAHINLGGYKGNAPSGTKLHSEVGKILKGLGYQNIEVSMDRTGDPLARYGSKDSVRLDAFEIKGNDLYIYDFKAGGARLSQNRIDEIKKRASQQNPNLSASLNRIVVIEVKL